MLRNRTLVETVCLLLCVSLFVTGCATRRAATPPGLQGAQPPRGLERRFEELHRDGQRNWVLHLNEMALESIRLGYRDFAERCLDEATFQILAVFGPTPEAARARSLFYAEDEKIFKGDAYERTMTLLLRGLLYAQAGDWENARASARSANLQDAFAEEREFAGDWAAPYWLIGASEARLGRPGPSQEALDRAEAARSALVANDGRFAPAAEGPQRVYFNPDHNLAVVAQLGRGPRKVRTGTYGEALRFQPGNRPTSIPLVVVDGNVQDRLLVLDSLYYQASTRGGRPVDRILKNKAIFKGTTETVGVLGAIAGLVILDRGASRDSEGAIVAGIIVLAAAAVIIVVSALTVPRADTRQWGPLPENIAVWSGRVEPGRRLVGLSPSAAGAVEVDVPPPGRGTAVVVGFPGPINLLLPPPSGQPPPVISTIPTPTTKEPSKP